MNIRNLAVGLSCAMLLSVGIAGAAAISVNGAKKYQTIEGFGGYGARTHWWGGDDTNSYFNEWWMHSLIDSLGCSVIRCAMPPGFEGPANDNGDPNVWDESKSHGWDDPFPNITEQTFKIHLPYWRALKNRGDVKIIISIWTPPPWQKTGAEDCGNGPGMCGGTVAPAMYEEFAERCANYVKMAKQYGEIDIYGFSIQNEPGFVEWYASCTYTAAAYVALFKVVGARFKKEGLTTKLFGPEDVINGGSGTEITNVMAKDAEAKGYLGAFAVHGYGDDGASPYSGSASMWANQVRIAQTLGGTKVWMTETEGSGTGNGLDWGFAWTHAQQLLSGLRDGNMSLFTWWWMTNQYYDEDAGGTAQRETITWRTSRHYYRFVRPGMQRVDATSSDAQSIYTVAFTDTAQNLLTVVVLNNGTGAQNISLNLQGLGAAPASLEGIISNQNTAFQPITAFQPAQGFSLPAQSIATLYNRMPPIKRGGTAVEGPRTGIRPMRTGTTAGGSVYSLDGRLLGLLRAGVSSTCFVSVEGTRARGGSTMAVRVAATAKH